MTICNINEKTEGTDRIRVGGGFGANPGAAPECPYAIANIKIRNKSMNKYIKSDMFVAIQ